MTASTTRVRISGNGTSAGTTITNLDTGEKIGPVIRYSITQERQQVAHAVIEVLLPQVDIECDATVRAVRANTPDEMFEHFLTYSGLYAEALDVKAKLRQAFDAAL
jgi:hypothetical protein